MFPLFASVLSTSQKHIIIPLVLNEDSFVFVTLIVVSHLFVNHTFFFIHHLDPLDIDPSSHPGVNNLLSLVDQSHIQQKLGSATNGRVERGEDPGVSVAGVLT